MQITSNTGSLQVQTQTSQGTPTTLPQADKPQYSNSEIYKMSQGNVTRDEDGNYILTAQGEVNQKNKNDAITANEEALAQSKVDGARSEAVEYLGMKSTQTRVAIYLSVATDGKSDSNSNSSTVSVIDALREAQKQNGKVEAYSEYKDEQKTEGDFY